MREERWKLCRSQCGQWFSFLCILANVGCFTTKDFSIKTRVMMCHRGVSLEVRGSVVPRKIKMEQMEKSSNATCNVHKKNLVEYVYLIDHKKEDRHDNIKREKILFWYSAGFFSLLNPESSFLSMFYISHCNMNLAVENGEYFLFLGTCPYFSSSLLFALSRWDPFLLRFLVHPKILVKYSKGIISDWCLPLPTSRHKRVTFRFTSQTPKEKAITDATLGMNYWLQLSKGTGNCVENGTVTAGKQNISNITTYR